MGLWRVFPYDPETRAGARFSKSHLPQASGSGRFDLGFAPVLYLAEDPEHAVGEKIARYRGTILKANHLKEFGYQLGIVEVDVSADVSEKILDLCRPANQLDLGIRSDQIAARDISVTQAIAQLVYDNGHKGLRWWSFGLGEWHGIVIFYDKISSKEIAFGGVEYLSLDHPAVLKAAEVLGMRIKRRAIPSANKYHHAFIEANPV